MTQAALIMILAMTLLPAGDVAGKILTTQFGLSPIYVVWSRFAIGALMAWPLASRSAWALLRDLRIWLRSMLLIGGITCIQFALRVESVPNVFGAFFIGPIFSVILSVVFLREPLSWLRALLLAVGFYGVIRIIDPSFSMSTGMILATCAGLFHGAFLTSSRWLATAGTPRDMLFIQMLINAGLMAPFGLWTMGAMPLNDVWILLANAAGSMLGNLLILAAYARVGAVILAPFVYFQLVAATALGWALYGDLPDQNAWIGIALVCIAGVASAIIAARPAPARADL